MLYNDYRNKREGKTKMKKFAVIASIGNHNLINGHGTIECTVNDVELVAESDDRMELFQKYGMGSTEYCNNGKWYSYRIEKRADARRILKQFDKLG